MSDQSDEIFFEAREIADPTARRAFLEEACGKAPGLRVKVESLIAAEEGADDYFADTLVDEPDTAASGESGSSRFVGSIERPGEMIGRYKLLQQIGEGGAGVVYLAQQMKPVKRRVALKVIKLGMDTKQVIARFEAERQALAMMDHPNIAKVLDAGTTDSGRPYFVMELVRGEPVTTFCDRKKLSTKERLKIFIQICKAVQHAHQKGIIHRDLKPGNVLVTMLEDRPVPKVIDFGVAKATQQQLTEKTLFTEHGHFIGTPAYMSPEQASLTGLDIDTRSDIYALGVLLYELLTGGTPFDSTELFKAGYDEIRRVIAEQDPLKPSTRISTMDGEELTSLATQRHSGPNRLRRLVRGDLDWIVMKALEKDRRRRYETANGFAMDISRFLTDEPVSAGRPSVAYKFGKFVRRHSTAVAAVLVLVAIVVAGLLEIGSRRRERDRLAQREREGIFLAAVEGRAALIGEKLKNIERHVAQYRKRAVRLLSLSPDQLPYRTPTKFNPDGFYYDNDYDDPGRRPPGMVHEEAYGTEGTEVSWQHVTVVRPPGADPEDGDGVLLDERRFSRMNDVFWLVHPGHEDIKWSFAGSSTGVFVGFPGFGRFRDKPDFDPRTRTWYEEAIRSDDFRSRWTRPYSDATTKEFMISCVSSIPLDGQPAGVVGVDVPMRRVQDWLRGQTQFPDETRCLMLVPFQESGEEPGQMDYRVFVDTTYNTSANHWQRVIEPRSIEELADPLRQYVRASVRGRGVETGPASVDGLLMASARIKALDWIIIVVSKPESGEKLMWNRGKGTGRDSEG